MTDVRGVEEPTHIVGGHFYIHSLQVSHYGLFADAYSFNIVMTPVMSSNSIMCSCAFLDSSQKVRILL